MAGLMNSGARGVGRRLARNRNAKPYKTDFVYMEPSNPFPEEEKLQTRADKNGVAKQDPPM